MKDPIKMANDLIAKGKKTNNAQLIKIGQEMIEQHKNKTFITQTRTENRTQQKVYDDNGNEVGQRAIKQPIKTWSENLWQDDGESEKDKANELLKKLTKRTERTRKPIQYVTVQCQACGKQEKVNPIHAQVKIYKCAECVKRMRII